VDLTLDDNGTKWSTVLTAGVVGARVCDSGDKSLSPGGKSDTARPVVGWWIFALKELKDDSERKHPDDCSSEESRTSYAVCVVHGSSQPTWGHVRNFWGLAHYHRNKW
jgi:hypothetical protein